MGDQGEREEVVVWDAVDVMRGVLGFFCSSWGRAGYAARCSHLFAFFLVSLLFLLVPLNMFVLLVLSLLCAVSPLYPFSLSLSLSCIYIQTRSTYSGA